MATYTKSETLTLTFGPKLDLGREIEDLNSVMVHEMHEAYPLSGFGLTEINHDEITGNITLTYTRVCE